MENTKQHECKYDEVIVRKGECDKTHTTVIRVYTDCKCSDSCEKPLITFHDNEILPCEENFKSWFSQVSPWFIQNGYKIKDLR